MCVNLVVIFKLCEKSFFLWKNLHIWQKLYTTAGRDGRDKSQLWATVEL